MFIFSGYFRYKTVDLDRDHDRMFISVSWNFYCLKGSHWKISTRNWWMFECKDFKVGSRGETTRVTVDVGGPQVPWNLKWTGFRVSSHMGQILQDGENSCFIPLFLKVEASCDQTWWDIFSFSIDPGQLGLVASRNTLTWPWKIFWSPVQHPCFSPKMAQ